MGGDFPSELETVSYCRTKLAKLAWNYFLVKCLAMSAESTHGGLVEGRAALCIRKQPQGNSFFSFVITVVKEIVAYLMCDLQNI